MGQELMDMTGFKGGMASAFAAELDPNQESLSDGIGSSYAIIKYKGKQWSLVYRGEQHFFVKEDGYGLEYLNMVILQQAPLKSKSYFPKKSDGSAYEEGSHDAPLCASIDGVVPDAGVPQKQAEACALCPRNVWKTSPDGKKIRECQDYKRIAVMLMPTQTTKLLGEPLAEPAFLRIPGASLENLSRMGDETKRQGYHFSSYITRVDFDPQQAYPKMRFKATQQLTNQEADFILKMRKDPIALRIIGQGEQRPQLAPPAAAQDVPREERIDTGIAAIANAPIRPPVTTGFIDVPATPIAVPLQTAAPTQTVQPSPQPPTPPPAQPSPPTLAAAPVSLADTGFSGMTQMTSPAPSPPAAAATTPASTVVADTGDPTDADAALDARIAALMPS